MVVRLNFTVLGKKCPFVPVCYNLNLILNSSQTIIWLNQCSSSDQSVLPLHITNTASQLGTRRFMHSTYCTYTQSRTHPHGMRWGFSQSRETWVALYYAGVPIATAAAAADRAGSVCVSERVCRRERSRLALRWESMQTLQEERQDMRILRRHTCRV